MPMGQALLYGRGSVSRSKYLVLVQNRARQQAACPVFQQAFSFDADTDPLPRSAYQVPYALGS
jgi:hypothetical protein